jgi:hypothetical protein
VTPAQSLRGNGINVELFERDASPWDRPQGYRSLRSSRRTCRSPGTALRDQDSYVVCVVGGRHEFFPDADGVLRACSPEELRGIAAEMLSVKLRSGTGG